MSSFVIGRTTANKTGVSVDCAIFIVFFNEIKSIFLVGLLGPVFKIWAESAKEVEKILGVTGVEGVTSPWG